MSMTDWIIKAIEDGWKMECEFDADRDKCEIKGDQFLAICQDNLDDPDEFVYTVYLINRSDNDIHLSMSTFTHASDDGDVITTNKYIKDLGKVESQSYIKIENDSIGSWDFITHFLFDITEKGIKKTGNFTVNKGYANGIKVADIPVLQESGYIIEADTEEP